MTVGLAISIFIGELAVRKLSPQLTFSEAFKYSINCLTNDPLIPVSLPKSYNCRMLHYRGDYDVYAHINSKGLRGEEFSEKSDQIVKRILVLGDSFTFGLGVSDTDTYPYQLERILKEKGMNVEVINAGYADGFAPDSYYLFLKERGLALSPDIVLVGFFVLNDITDISESIWSETDVYGLPTKIESCCRTADGGVFHNKQIAFKYKYPYLRDSHLFQFVINTLNKRFGLFNEKEWILPKRDVDANQGCIMNPGCVDRFKEEEEKMHLVMQGIKKLTQDKGIPLLVVLIPPDYQLYPEMSGKYQNRWEPPPGNVDFLQKRIDGFFKQNGIPFLDLYPVFDKERQRGYPYFQFDAHFNALGQRITAEAIAKYFTDNKLLEKQ